MHIYLWTALRIRVFANEGFSEEFMVFKSEI